MTSIAQAYQQEALQQGMQRGMQQGIQQGMQRGMQQGIQQGMQRGMQHKALDIARYMLYTLHLGVDKVQEATGLSRQLVEVLAQKQ